MPSSFFMVRLVPNRADFPARMTAEEEAAMGAHFAFLDEQLAAGTLVVAGPVLDPAGVFGMGVYEASSLEEVTAMLARDPANAVGRYVVAPMGASVARAAEPRAR
jgi:uncharacterized protein YciI